FDSEKWFSDIIYRCYQISYVEAVQRYFDVLYNAVKEHSKTILGKELPVTANLIPSFPMAELLRDKLDMPDYEWRMSDGYGFFPTGDGYYPDTRLGWSTRLASKMSKT